MHEGTTSHKLDRRSDHRSEPDDRDHHRPEADPDWAVDEVLATAGGPSDEVPVSQEVRLEDFALEFWGYNRQQVADALQNLTARLAAVTQKLAAAAQLRIELREARQEIWPEHRWLTPEWPGRLVELIQGSGRRRSRPNATSM